MMRKFSLEGEDFIPLCDLLKRLGLCESGGQAKQFISQGLVKVKGEVELRKRRKLAEGDLVEFNRVKVSILP